MEDRKETLSVLIYMYNKWSLAEAQKTFGEGEYGLGAHMFSKWQDYNCDTARFICELDEGNYNKLVERACSLYCGRRNR